ncbi:phosphotransferase [Neisseriaceae bacterium CLB008]|nr:phosphotransferase [Neisseriaceae bacterium]
MSMNERVSHQNHNTDAGYVEVLTIAPPDIELVDAVSVAQTAYGYVGAVKPLGGERDKNYLVESHGRPPMVLKFINIAETADEIDVQIQVLNWLAKQPHQVCMPQNLATLDGEDLFWFEKNNQVIRVRAYTFIEGQSILGLAEPQALYGAFGATAAQMVTALKGFDHPALERVLLWDMMHLMQLTEWLAQIDLEDALKIEIAAFFEHFGRNVWPQLQALPQQVIHGDLSKSNTVASAAQPDQIHGVLDFGDLCRGPRVVELAIAASYAIDESDQALLALPKVMAGYESLLPLTAQERALLPDLVKARLVQRMVISKWRAQKFPNNERYILRATNQAVALFKQFIQ